jgi:hypothetical protein
VLPCSSAISNIVSSVAVLSESPAGIDSQSVQCPYVWVLCIDILGHYLHSVNFDWVEVPMKAVQLRMARAAVGWGVRDLAKKAGVTANTRGRETIHNGRAKTGPRNGRCRVHRRRSPRCSSGGSSEFGKTPCSASPQSYEITKKLAFRCTNSLQRKSPGSR